MRKDAVPWVVALACLVVMLSFIGIFRERFLALGGRKKQRNIGSGACVSPSGETSSFLQWANGADRDIAEFEGILNESNGFAGKWVSEGARGSGTGTTDTCYFDGSIYPKYTDQLSIFGYRWKIGSGGAYGPDYIGYGSANLDQYYHARQRTPCELGTTQHMKFICPDLSLVEYCTNKLRIVVGDTGTVVWRAGAEAYPPHFAKKDKS